MTTINAQEFVRAYQHDIRMVLPSCATSADFCQGISPTGTLSDDHLLFDKTHRIVTESG